MSIEVRLILRFYPHSGNFQQDSLLCALRLRVTPFGTGQAMRNTYLVTYDIRDDKRLRKVFRTMRNWGEHLQYSVFECQLTPSDRLILRAQLKEIINHSQDQVLFIDLGPSDARGDRSIEAIGQPYTSISRPCVII